MQKQRTAYHVIRSRYVTEKTAMLEGLQNATSNKCLIKCTSPKFVFLVDQRANKREIAKAVEALYPAVKVTSVNTMNVYPKKRRVRGFRGFRSRKKKAIVTLQEGDSLGETS